MPEKVNHCPLCGSERQRTFAKVDFREHTVTNQICRSCGFVFQSPRMTSGELDAFYAREYRQVYQGSEGPTLKDLAIQKGRAATLLAFVQDEVPSFDRYLDVGCSAGILLKTFQDHFACQAVGVEPGEVYRIFAETQGFQVYREIDELGADGVKPFDLVSMAHVLEHIPDPVAYLTHLREKYLKPGGYLLIEVPNLYFHDSFEIAHMSSFSGHTLQQTIQKAGFTITAEMKHGKPRSRLLPLYVTVLASASPNPADLEAEPEKGVRLKRRLGFFVRRILLRVFPNSAWEPIKIGE
ncbi:MAG: class I SAM-dependent methyltransferase [Anaerolineales bacterium]|nr:class I SAM-dependent methyltransferase [Anaerolineales bacterium]